MSEDELDKLQDAVAAGGRANAEAPLHLAKALQRAERPGEAIVVLREAIKERVSDDAGELDCARLECSMRDLLAQLLRPRQGGIPRREWRWQSPSDDLQRGVCVVDGTLRWTYQWKPSDVVALNEQSISSFVASGPPGPGVPEHAVRELISLLAADGRPWISPYIGSLDIAKEEAVRLETPWEGLVVGPDEGDMVALGGMDPGVARARAEAEASVIQGAREVLRALVQEDGWFEARDHGQRRWVRHDERFGWYEILLDEAGRVRGAKTCPEESAAHAVLITLGRFPEALTEAVEAVAFARTENIRTESESALGRLRHGEVWQQAASPAEQLVTWTPMGWAWAEVAEHRVTEMHPRKEEEILGRLFCDIASGNSLTLTRSTKRHSDVDAKGDRRLYPEMLRNGELALGGGIHGSPWTISFVEGRFIQQSGTYSVEIDEVRLVDQLMTGRFGWARFLAPRRSGQ